MVYMPLASALIKPAVAAPVLLMCDLISSTLLLRASLQTFSWFDVRYLLLGALIGFPAGIEILTRTDPVVLRWTAISIILVSLAFIGSGWRYRGPQSAPLTTAVGCTSGLMSGVAQIGNPPILAYWLGVDMPPERMRANLIVYFTILTAIGIAVFAFKGLLDLRVLTFVAAALPGYALGMWMGNRLFPLASRSTFRGIAFAMIVMSILLSLPVLDDWFGRK